MDHVADVLRRVHALDYSVAFVPGNDSYTEQDVAFLVRKGFKYQASRFPHHANGPNNKDISKHAVLRLDVPKGVSSERVLIVTVHLIAAGDEDRRRQCRTLRSWLGDRMEKGEDVIVLGDTNCPFPFDKTPRNGDLGILRGLETPSIADDLTDLNQFLEPQGRKTHVTGKELDRVLVSKALLDDTPGFPDLVFDRIEMRKDLVVRKGPDRNHQHGFWRIPENERDTSDHYPLVTIFRVKN